MDGRGVAVAAVVKCDSSANEKERQSIENQMDRIGTVKAGDKKGGSPEKT